MPGRKFRAEPMRYDKHRCKRRNRIEIMFARLKDWPRVATRCGCFPRIFSLQLLLAAPVIGWLRVLTPADIKCHFFNTSYAISRFGLYGSCCALQTKS